ncbi:SH3-like domain-containing protein [Pseudovibrio sp. Tun.PSC04-5.I4]
MISEAEIAAATMIDAPIPVKGKLEAQDVNAVLFAGGPANRDPQGSPTWSVGDQIKTTNNHPKTHTRLPRYARDKNGQITKIHGFHVFPDSNSQGQGEDPNWLYQVTFKSRDLWGDQGNDVDTMSLDLWEPYLRANL